MLGARIAALRRQAGQSQTELAQLLGVSPSAVGMYEQGRREPGGAILVALAENFGVSTDYLLTGRVSPREQSDITALLEDRIAAVQKRLKLRGEPFGTEELALLLTAILTNE